MELDLHLLFNFFNSMLRNITIVLCALLLPALAFAQNHNTQRIYLTNGTVIIGEAQKQADGTIKVSTDSGDFFFFQPSEVERIIDAKQALANDTQIQKTQRLFLKDGRAFSGVIVVTEDGTYQIETVEGEVYSFSPDEVDGVVGLSKDGKTIKPKKSSNDVVFRKGYQLFYTKNNQLLTQHDFNTLAGWEKYEKAKKNGRAGRICMYSGAGTLVLGGALMVVGFTYQRDGLEALQGVGFILGIAGLASGITGLTMTLISNSKLNKIANTYNQNPGYALNFGVQQNGIGLAFNF